MDTKVFIGDPFPLGATWDGNGVNFAIYSQCATSVELCLFNSILDQAESVKIRMTERSGHIWHVYLPDMQPGQLYGFRVFLQVYLGATG